MKRTLIILTAVFIFTSCNNEKNSAAPSDDNAIKIEEPTATAPATPDYTPTTNLTFDVEGTEINNGASILVTKDKDKMQANVPYACMLTSNAAKNNNEYLTVNFLMDTKPGTYPVIGASLNRGTGDKNEMYGGLLGGKPKLTKFNVTLTECKDLGSNNMGGNKWSISGYWEEIIIDATKIMLMDKTRSHPAQVRLGKGSFSNLTFDDNWDEMMNKVMDK